MGAAVWENGMTSGGMLAISCCILILLCVAFLFLMDGVRLYSGWPTRGLFFLAAFGADALLCSLLDAGVFPSPGERGRALQRAAEQLLFLWMPFLLMIYYTRVVRAGFRRRMRWVLCFDAGLAAFLTALFFILPKERIVAEVYTLFLLAVSAVTVVITLLQWHGGQKGYRRIYWESAALLVLFGVSTARFAGEEGGGDPGGYAALRILGIAVFMLIMTATQFYAILMEYRAVVERTAKQLEEQNADLTRAHEEAETARREAEAASEAKSAFLARMYHEIRTPINAVLGMDEMILREAKDEAIRGYATDIYAAGQRIQALVDDTPTEDFAERIARMAGDDYRESGFVAPEARLLVVDDNAMNRRVFRQLLKETEVQIDEAAGGREALALAEKTHYDLIFLDHMMPEMDGVETLAGLRRMQRETPDFPCAETPVWVLTANAVAGARERFLADGFDGFIAKPIVTEKLEEILRTKLPGELLRERRTDASARDVFGDEKGVPSAGAGSANAAGEGGAGTGPPDDLPAVDGLDWNYAWLHLPDEELLAETVRDFHELLPGQMEKLEKYYAEAVAAGEPEDAASAWSAYRIQVHGMKSAAATVGIVPLAGAANLLEYAARDGRADVIHALHPTFAETWCSYREKLAGVFGIGEEMSGGEEADAETLFAMLAVLESNMEELDVDAADQTIAELKKYRYDDAGRERLMRLSAAVTDLDGDLVSEIAEEWRTAPVGKQ